MKKLLLFASAILLSLACISCSQQESTSTTSSFKLRDPNKKLNFCAAIRGNGTYIYSHFGSIAKVVEEYGEFDAISGGSSAAISAFLYESIAINPLLEKADKESRALYISLMFKSMSGFLTFLSTTEEAQAISYLSDVANTVEKEDLYALFKVNWFKAARRLFVILNDEDIKALVNSEVLKDLNILHDDAPKSYQRRIEDILISIKTFSEFAATDSSIFFREGIASFEGFSRLIGKTANFFAGSEKLANKKLEKFLSACAKPAKGKIWKQIATIKPDGINSCESLYLDAISTYKDRVESSEDAIETKDDRLKHKLGQFLPVFVPSAIIEDADQIAHYKESIQRYYKNEDIQYRPDFKKIDFAYFVPEGSGAAIMTGLKAKFPNDLKSNKVSIINRDKGVEWKKVLQLSPLEPGLGKVKITDDSKRAFIGGFGDLHPVQVLRAANCEKVIFLNRIGVESSFVAKQRSIEGLEWKDRQGVAELLNISSADHRALYLDENPNNSYQTAVDNADAVWCTDWDNWKGNEINEMLLHAYGKLPTKEGPNKGHTSAISIINHKQDAFFRKDGVRRIKSKKIGCSRR